ncbi:thermonuclease family protein [Oceanobacillus sp. FSL H7-0719]|uniref:thermonuclease family protein n=1 Tax=Oceanobacillus sp. FSL H7-0719 TaxID=2954507 RepID=UPI003253952C
MLRKIFSTVFLFIILITAACISETEVIGEKATFIRAVDGDTLIAEIDGQEEYVRLLLIDTPETKHPTKDVQPFGFEASKFMETAFEKNETIYLEFGTEKRDKYDRILAYLYNENGDMINELLLEEGLARVAFVYPPNDKYVDDFYEIEEKARNKNSGIWSIPGYVTDYGFNSDALN